MDVDGEADASTRVRVSGAQQRNIKRERMEQVNELQNWREWYGNLTGKGGSGEVKSRGNMGGGKRGKGAGNKGKGKVIGKGKDGKDDKHGKAKKHNRRRRRIWKLRNRHHQRRQI